MADKSILDLIHQDLKRFMFKKGWQELKPIQEASVKPILDRNRDVIISASTASGKTEAAFLPALTGVLNSQDLSGIRILYISPLKALINDQFRRLEEMTEFTNLKVTPWHGDVSASKKNALLSEPKGIILTTPESLESLLINHVEWLKDAMKNLFYVVIDEFHAFMGTQRGYQLQSQLHRIENLISKRVYRIALSATFSDANCVLGYLRANSKIPCQVITTPSSDKDLLSIQIKGYDHVAINGEDEISRLPDEYNLIANDIFRLLRGSTNLVFCNSRFCTEALASKLETLCKEKFVPVEFFPHHGSLSRDLRESLEYRLQEGRWPTTAICTATLELGIDISDVSSIAQVDHPVNVASLRQRLGRAGRREHNAVLRVFLPEGDSDTQHLELFENTALTVAMIELLLERWYEPPLDHEYAFSTLLQQTLSVIASFGSVSAKSLYDLLCKTGPFSLNTPKIYMQFLKCLGEKDLIVQLNDGTLALGLEGEKMLSAWSFFAAFDTPSEFTIEHDGQNIGTVPLTRDLMIDDTFLFAGRGWKVNFFSQERHVIGVKPYPHDAQPLSMNGSAGHVHDRVRERMLKIYKEGKIPQYLNKTAKEHLQKGIALFHDRALDTSHIYEGPLGISLFPWKGDRVIRTIVLMLKREAVSAVAYKSHIELEYTPKDSLKVAVHNILDTKEIDEIELIKKINNLDRDKHDGFISMDLKRLAFAHSELDVKGALEFFKVLNKELCS
ncbi:MAG: DEAD/DEAH box helicase [Succinivibrio sp.]|nr:DEAD/DEAH box helicase [Succinivibrio sp.]